MKILQKISGAALIFLAAACLCSGFFFLGKSNPVKGKVTQKENEKQAWDALKFLSAAAAFPNADIPPDGYAKAWAFYTTHYLSVSYKTAPARWSTMGPVNTGGRTIGIALDPNDTSIIYLGSASGGLWKSINGGRGDSAWTYIPTGYPALGVAAIAIDPGNNKVMYIGTGETYQYAASGNGIIYRPTRGTFGIGILKTTNGGATWYPALNWTYQENRSVWKIVFNPQNPNTILAATTEGIYKSNDSGHTWNNVLAEKMVMDMAVDESDSTVYYAGVGDVNAGNHGVYKSTDGGNTWARLTNGLPPGTNRGRTMVSVYEKNTNIVYAHISDTFQSVGTYVSTDKGLHWRNTSTADITSYQGFYAQGLLIKPDSPSKILAGGVYIFRSNDSGQDFSQISSFGYDSANNSHSDNHGIIANPKDPEKIYAITDGGLFRSNDFGRTFYDCNQGLVTTQFYIGSVSQTDSTVMLGGLQDNYVQKRLFYNNWFGVIGGDGCYNAIDPTDDYTQYGAWQYLNILISNDQGFNFNTYGYVGTDNTNGYNPAAFLAPYILCPSNTQVIYAGQNNMQLTTDAMNTWHTAGPASIDSGNYILTIGVSSTSADSLYCATGPSDAHRSRVYRSTDSGNTYTDITGNLPNRYPRRIFVNPYNSNEVYIVYAGFGGGHIFKSKDAGAHWKDISTALPDLPFHSIVIDPQNPNTIYAGCDFTVFMSTDTGNTWSALNTGFPDAVMVFDLVISPSNRNLLAFTYGHGVFTIPLAGSANTGINTRRLLAGQVSLSPNPAGDFVNLRISGTNAKQADIEIYNLSGKLVESYPGKTLNNGDIRLSTVNLQDGEYIVNINVAGQAYVKKMLIAR